MTKQDEQFLEIHSWGIHILLLFLILLVKISRHFKSFTFEAKSQTVDELESHDANVLPTDTSFHLLMRVCCLSILPKNKKKITERNTEVKPRSAQIKTEQQHRAV